MSDIPEDQGMPAMRNIWATLTTPRAGRVAAGLGLLLFLLGLGRSAAFLVRMHDGIIGGDSFTYVTSAKRLAQGTLFYMDGPVADMVARAQRPAGRRHWEPIWNHTVRPDGRTVCSMAIGYPQLLSLAYRTGGLWLLYHLNLVLTLGFLALLALVVWEGLGRDRFAGLAGATVALLLPFIFPQAIRQFTFPWREPYFYSLLLGAVWALLRFQRSGRGAWLCAVAFLSGLACSVKEANALYVLWFGVMVLSLPAYRRHPRLVWLTLGCLALFIAGLAPLLVQNAVGTGNPLVSCQFLRETREFSLDAPGAGLSMGNMDSTLARYLAMYSANPFYQPWALALAGLGVVVTTRRLLGRTMLGVAVLHFLLYTHWGNADLRQSFFFNVPYAFFLVAGPFVLAEWLARSARARLAVRALQLAVLAVLALGPSPFYPRGGAPRLPIFLYADGRRLSAEIDAQIPEDGLLLVNRSIRDILGVFSQRHIARLSELYNLHPDQDVQPLVAPLVDSGRLYFLDNVDQDPHYAFRANRTRIDQQTLLARYRFEPVAELDRDAFKLGGLIDKPKLSLYRVMPWGPGPGRGELETPKEGAAFLFVNRRSAASNLVVELDGQAVPLPEDGGYFCPVADRTLGPKATVEWRIPDGSPVPPLDDLAFIGWHESMVVDFGLDAVPRDLPHLPGGQTGAPCHAPFRNFPSNFRLRLPAFARPGIFCAYSLMAGGKDDIFEILRPDQKTVRSIFSGGKAWFAVPESVLGAEAAPVATNLVFGFRALSNSSVRVSAVHAYPCRRSVVVSPRPESRGYFWSGRIVSELSEEEYSSWSMSRDGTLLASGAAHVDPFSKTNNIHHVGEFPPGAAPIRFDIQGGGLIDFSEIQVGEVLDIRLDRPTRFFIAYELYGLERNEQGEWFCWSTTNLPVQVPLTPGAKEYCLRLDALDGNPGEPRTLEVAFGGASASVVMSAERRVYEWTFPAPEKDWGLAPLEFRIAAWSPSRQLGSKDSRDLGFQFYGLDWRPADSAGVAHP